MSYTNNTTSIVAGTGISVSPVSGTGSNTITISALGTQLVTTRIATATPVTVTDSDDVVSVEVSPAAAVTVNLPAGVNGREFTIKDGNGNASILTPITVVPAAGNIDGATSATINVPFGSLTLVYDGVKWLII